LKTKQIAKLRQKKPSVLDVFLYKTKVSARTKTKEVG